jgi:hypothetical protein
MDRDSLLVGFHDEQSSYNFHNTPSRLLIDEPLHDTLDELRVPRAAARRRHFAFVECRSSRSSAISKSLRDFIDDLGCSKTPNCFLVVCVVLRPCTAVIGNGNPDSDFPNQAFGPV